MTDLWTTARQHLSTVVSPEVVATWLDPVTFDGIRDGALLLRVPTRFHAEWLLQHYETLLLSTCRDILIDAGQPDLVPVRMRCAIDPALSQPPTHVMHPPPAPEPRRQSERPDGLRPELNPKYTFESFVVGSSNQLAHAASLAAATQPGRRYNPLFLCGDVGLGKTHLANAIGQHILANQPDARILYVSAEKFTNDFISGIKNHQMEQFRATYRESCDVLLMDDIQFIAKRESTMEEFFHTFNALHHADKQIVVTSDVYPENLEGMEARIISRFQSGMVADIQAPDVDTRVAILEKKAESEGIELDESVAIFIAQTVKNNVRELEGTLVRLAVQAELLGKPMDLEHARMALRASQPRGEAVMTVDDVQRAVCEYFGVRLADIKGKRKQQSIVLPRMIAMYLCRHHLGTSYPELGERFGGRDHTTVIHAVQRITGMLVEEDVAVTGPLGTLQRRLGVTV